MSILWVPVYVAVDCFVLISGFFMINSKFKAKSIVRIVGGVWCYTLLFSFLRFVIAGDIPGRLDILKMVFPITTKKFWFVNAYIAMYLIIPFMNKLIHSLTKRQFEYLLLILLVMFPLRLTFLPLTWSQDGSGGMSVILFIVLYCIAAWLRLYYDPQTFKAHVYLCGYLATAVFLVISKWMFLQVMPADYTTKLYGYISIFTIFEAICLFLFFLNLRSVKDNTADSQIQSEVCHIVWVQKAILTIAPHSFAVYIIHFCMNDVLWTKILHVDSAVENAVPGLAAVLGACVLVYSICIIIDMIRTSIARLIGKALIGTMINTQYNNLISKWDNIADLV